MTREEAIEGARRTLAELRALEAKKDKLLAEVERSLAIMQLWPDAFKQGAVKSAWVGVAPSYFRKQDDRRLRITDGAGTVKEFPKAEVPTVLWPGGQP